MLNTGKFAGRTAVISGASRGIGKAIALKLAKDGANVAIFAKTATAHKKLPGTIYTAAEEIEKAGGKALPCIVDVRDEQSVLNAVDETVKKFGGIDICINNASAISLTGTLNTPMKSYDLMHQINSRGTFMLTQKCLPYLKRGKNPHVLMLSPPLQMDPVWFSNHVAYTMAKYGMSMCVLGMHEELRPDGVAVNALWPKTTIWTAAMEMLSGGKDAAGSRKDSIVADAAYAMLSRNSREFTGQFAIDEDILKEEGVIDFEQYSSVPGAPLHLDFFIPGAAAETFAGGDPNRKRAREDIKSANVDESVNFLRSALNNISGEKLKGSAIYLFVLNDDKNNPRKLYIDIKNKAITEGEPSTEADVTFSLSSSLFSDLINGTQTPTAAFMSKQLKIRGDITQAMKLEKILLSLHKK